MPATGGSTWAYSADPHGCWD